MPSVFCARIFLLTRSMDGREEQGAGRNSRHRLEGSGLDRVCVCVRQVRDAGTGMQLMLAFGLKMPKSGRPPPPWAHSLHAGGVLCQAAGLHAPRFKIPI